MDIDRKQRTDIDTVTNDRLTLAIDESNIEDNPYVHETIKGMEGNNWVKEGMEYVKYNLVEDDNLILMYDPITKLSQKSINKVTVSFDYVLSNNINRPILDNISLVADSTYHEIVNYELNNSGHVDIDCGIFGIDEVVLNTIISIQGFGIGLNFNGKYSNATIRISNVKVSFKYSDKLYDESGSVINRLEPYIDFYRDDDGDLILQIGGDATGKGMDRGGTIDTYSKTEIDNKLATKVDTQIGKGLSSNDYTNAEKTKLSGIAENANYYIHPPNHNSSIITETSALTNLGTDENATQHEINIEIDTALSNKVDVNSLSTVATTGDYDDLDNKPTIPSNISDLTNDSDFIEKSNTIGLVKNDGTIDTTSYSTFSGSYNDLSNKPSIPTSSSDLSDGSDLIKKSSTTGLIKNDGTIKQKIGDITIDGAYDNIYPNTFAQDSQGVDRILFADASDTDNIRACEYLPSYVIQDSNAHSHIGSSANANQSVINSAIDTALGGKSDVSHNHDDRYYTETEIDTALNTKQATLVSGTNIKTVNNQSLLGSGNIVIQGGGTGVDIATSWGNPTSDSKVPSEKLAKDTLDGKANVSHTHTKSEITDFPSIPSKTSDLNNDSGFITSSSLPTKVSDLQNDTGFITSSALPTKTSDLTNDGDGSNVFVKDNDSRLSNARTPLAHTHLSSDVTDLIDVIYPVGSIYMSVNSVNPSTLFGGTWEQIKDTFLLSSGDTYSNGATGGSATVSLSASQMPRHNHSTNAHSHSTSNSGEYFVTNTQSSANNTRVTYGSSGDRMVDGFNTTNSIFHHRANTNSQAPSTKYTGGTASTEAYQNGSAHENMPPYLVVNVWKRTA